MILCGKDCIPCCDYCFYAKHESMVYNGKTIDGGCVGCSKHMDGEHQCIAVGCGYCEDFLCKNVSYRWIPGMDGSYMCPFCNTVHREIGDRCEFCGVVLTLTEEWF